MENETQLVPVQRKGLIDMLNRYGDVWERVFDRYNSTRSTLKSSYIREAAEKEGALEAATHVITLREHLEKAESALRSSGFTVDTDGDIELLDDDSSLERYLEKRLDQELGKRKKLEEQFEKGKLKLWTVPTSAEAEKIVEDLLSIK